MALRVPDVIRIVPLRLEGAPPAPAAAPELTYRGGPLLANVEVVAVYWGAQWRDEPLATLAGRLDGFFDFVLTSDLVDQLAEYDVEGVAIGHGTRVASSVLDNVPTDPALTDQQLRDGLRAALPPLPAPNPNRLYSLFLPPGVAVVMGGSRSCQAFCGYHDAIDGEIFYAVLPYPGCPGCRGGDDEFDALTSTTSHELCEAITDPVPGTGWYDDVHGEIADICAWRTKRLGDYVVQLEWSNAERDCM
ncbi:MAG TPA: hypothetical protein VE269_02585 [Gaiellaceae bacterium]|nr:hypothetical protein [Gaiellaceae bacterium]